MRHEKPEHYLNPPDHYLAVVNSVLDQLSSRLKPSNFATVREQLWRSVAQFRGKNHDQYHQSYQHLISAEKPHLRDAVLRLSPWRKGPFTIDGLTIDSEWDCRLKWDRVSNIIPSYDGLRVADVGGGNGFYGFEIAHQWTPELTLVCDPSALYYFQFYSIQHYYSAQNIYYLPLKWQEMGGFNTFFDVILCMGVLYHNRDPLALLSQLKALMSSKGKVILETLIIDDEDEIVLFPKDRYAQMPNVYFLPSISALTNMVLRAGFSSVEVVDVSKTTPDEQRVTPFSSEVSLADFLDPQNSELTIEGYPGPLRATLLLS